MTDIKEKRSRVIATILKGINIIDPSGHNAKLYEDRFNQMSDDEFIAYIEDLRNKRIKLRVIAPNFGPVKLDVKRNIEYLKSIDRNPFQRFWTPPSEDGKIPGYWSKPYLTIPLPINRKAQLLIKKISIPKNNTHVDSLTGQPTGDSKGSKISYPEIGAMMDRGLDASLYEFLTIRGGDRGAMTAADALIERNGEVSILEASKYATGVQSVKSLNRYLRGMHVRPINLVNE